MGHFTSPHHRRVVQCFVPPASRSQSGSAIPCPSSPQAAAGPALQRIPSSGHRPTYGPATKMAFQSCSWTLQICRSTETGNNRLVVA